MDPLPYNPVEALFFRLLDCKLTFKLQRTASEYAAKRSTYKRPDQQKYTE